MTVQKGGGLPNEPGVLSSTDTIGTAVERVARQARSFIKSPAIVADTEQLLRPCALI